MRRTIKTPRRTDRDQHIAATLVDYGVLDLYLVQLLFFPQSAATARKKLATQDHKNDHRRNKLPIVRTVGLRMEALEEMGLVRLSNREQTAKAGGVRVVWAGSSAVAMVAKQQGVLPTDIHWQKPGARLSDIDHDVWANYLRAMIELSCDASDEFSVKEAIPERILAADPDTITFLLPQGNRTIERKRRILPDLYLALTRQGEEERPFRLLIEVDNSTHSQARIVREKLHAGLTYISSPQYKKRFGDNRGRWLYFMESEKRMHNLKEHCVRALGKGAAAFYFTTFDRVLPADVLHDPVWFLGGAATTPQSLAYAIRTRA